MHVAGMTGGGGEGAHAHTHRVRLVGLRLKIETGTFLKSTGVQHTHSSLADVTQK